MPHLQRLEQQLQFLTEIDRLKTVLRQNVLIDKSRRENDAEHSWHMAVVAMVLLEYAELPGVNLLRVLQMVLVHDLVEIYAGDTFCYDDVGNADKAQREQQAADALFCLLPQDQAQEYRALWEEFEQMQTPDALYAAAVDRLQPFLLNYNTDGHTWQLGQVTQAQVRERLRPVRQAMPAVWKAVEAMLRECVDKGLLRA